MMTQTQKESIKNKIAEGKAHRRSPEQIANELKKIPKADLIRIIQEYQEEDLHSDSG